MSTSSAELKVKLKAETKSKLDVKIKSKSKTPPPSEISFPLVRVTPTPLPPILIKFAVATANITSSFMTAENLARVSTACHGTRLLFKSALDDKRAEELLQQEVLNANPTTVMELLVSLRPDNRAIILKKSRRREEYRSEKTGKMEPKREWRSGISPLEAAAWAGDNFLVKMLLEYVPQELNCTAGLQLQGIRNRNATEENGGYLAPYRALQAAYELYIGQFDVLHAAQDWKTLNELWLQGVGRCQFLLPMYGLQEFCDNKPHDPLPSFNLEPKRSCLLNEGSPLNLDSVGVNFSLLKLPKWSGCFVSSECMTRGCASLDLAAIGRLCSVRTLELDDIINSLLNPIPVAEHVPVQPIHSQSRCLIS